MKVIFLLTGMDFVNQIENIEFICKSVRHIDLIGK